MEFQISLAGTKKEMDKLFEEQNVRSYERVTNQTWKVTIRSCENFNPHGIVTIVEMNDALNAHYKQGTQNAKTNF